MSQAYLGQLFQWSLCEGQAQFLKINIQHSRYNDHNLGKERVDYTDTQLKAVLYILKRKSYTNHFYL